MSGINFPVKIDWFNGIVSGIVASVITAFISALIKGEIGGLKTAKYFLVFITITLMLFYTWYNVIGMVYFDMAFKEEKQHGCGNAIYMYESATRWNPKINDSRWRLVGCSIILKRPEDALPILEEDENILSNDAEYWKQLSLLYTESNDLDNTLKVLTRYIDMWPKDVEEWTDKIGSDLMDKRRLVETEATMRLFRVRANNDKPAVFWLAWALFEQEKYQDALYHFDVCINDYKPFGNSYKLGRCYAGKGFIYFRMGYSKDARKSFVEAISIYSEQPDVKDVLIQMP